MNERSVGRIHIEAGDCMQAKDALLEALRIGRALKDADATAGALVHLGEAELTMGDITQAEAHFRESHELCLSSGWQPHIWLSLARNGLGEIASSRYEYDRAHEVLRMGVERSVFARLRLLNLDSLAGVIGTMPRRTTDDGRRTTDDGRRPTRCEDLECDAGTAREDGHPDCTRQPQAH